MKSRKWSTAAAVAGLLGLQAAAFTAAAGATTGAKPEVGWWSEAQQAPSPLPVNAVTGQNLMVGNDPANGPNAVAAVRFTVPDNIDGAVVDPATVPATLTLHVAENSAVGTVAVVACVIDANWQPVEGGAWADHPTWSCNPEVPVSFAGDGKTATVQLSPANQRSAGLYDLALIPKPGDTDPFSVQFLPPGADGVAVGAGTSPSSLPPEIPASESTDFAPVAPDTGVAVTPDLGASSGSYPAYGGPSVATPPAASATASRPATRLFNAVPVRKIGSQRGQRALAFGILAALGLALWWFGGQQTRSPRLLGSLGEHASADEAGLYVRTGGIGRFARPRSRPPVRL